MKKALFLLAAGLPVASIALADSACPPPPSSGTNNLVSLGYVAADGTTNGFTCHIGNLDFSNFSFSSASLTPNEIVVTPITTSLDQGFTFSSIPMSVNNTGGGAPQTEDATIFYNVTDTAGAAIDDIGISFNGAASGTGNAQFTERFCTAGTLSNCTGSTGTVQVFVPPNSNLVNETLLTPNTSFLAISKDFSVSTGASGQASISVISNTYSQVPEPGSLSLLSLVLLGGVGLAKKLQRSHLS